MKFLRALFLSVFLIGPASAADYVAGSVSGGNIPAQKTSGTACVGCIGQTLQSIIASGSAVALTTATAANVTTISLTAGNWLVWGSATFAPAGSTTVSFIQTSVSTTSATLPSPQGAFPSSQIQATFVTGGNEGLTLAPVLISVSSTTPVYLVVFSQFGVSTMGAYGSLTAMRVY